MTLLLAVLAAAAAAVAGWRCCVVLRIEPLLDELDQAVADSAQLMRQKVALLAQNDERDRRVPGVAQHGATERGAL